VVTGPGVYDMKGGWACFLAALDLLSRRGAGPGAPLLVVITCDEEVGSPTSRALIEEAARTAGTCLVLEPSIPGGGVKIRRKGTGEAVIRVEGRPAHAGIEPEKGASAVHELARQILAAVALAAPDQGTHLNVGLVKGGTGANVVAAQAQATVDFRFWSRSEAERVEAGLRGLTAVDPGCRVEVEGGVNRWALEPTPESEELYLRAREAAARVGLDLEAGATGGASDGNLAAGVGCPTLDGLGPDGGGAHSMHEHIRVASLPSRIALLAGLLEAL
jgi:glutamate carboxypeptidase